VERPKLEVADILRRYGESYRAEHEGSLTATQRRVMQAMTACRTAALGGHREQCDTCEHQRIAYNSCRNRHLRTSGDREPVFRGRMVQHFRSV